VRATLPDMGWSTLGTQFCLELAFGVFVALACVHRSPLGVFFFRLMGTTGLIPVLLAMVLPVMSGQATRTSPFVLCAGLALLAYPAYSGPVKQRTRGWALLLAVLGSGAALVLVIGAEVETSGPLQLAAASFSALATGSVAGTVGVAMVLGHWYLTIPGLDVSHLARLNRVTMVAMAASLVALALVSLAFTETLSAARTPLLGPWGLFYLGTRSAVGLVLPMLFAWMTIESLKHNNTRSATGILYASTVLVLIGTAVSISLQDSYGVPL